MTDEFIAQGLEADRYLKAMRLVDQFDSEIEAKLQQICGRMEEAHPDLFSPDASMSPLTKRSPNPAIAFSRVNYPMARKKSATNAEQLTLNVHLYWRDPTDTVQRDIEGTLRQFGYKIKGAKPADDQAVIDRMDSDTLETTDNPWDSNKCFYRHVQSLEALTSTADALVEHFAEHGPTYGVEREE
jgi:hypothetical protein